MSGTITHLARGSLLVRSVLYLLAAAMFAMGLLAFVDEQLSGQGSLSAGAILAGVMGPLLVWWELGSGILRLRTAVLGGAWIRVDDIGVHYRVAADTALYLGLHRMAEGTVRWNEIQETTYYRMTYGGITTRRMVYLVHPDKSITAIDLYPFKESIQDVLAAITAARPKASKPSTGAEPAGSPA